MSDKRLEAITIIDTTNVGPMRIRYIDGIVGMEYRFVGDQAIGRPRYRGWLGLIYGIRNVVAWSVHRVFFHRRRSVERRASTGGR